MDGGKAHVEALAKEHYYAERDRERAGLSPCTCSACRYRRYDAEIKTTEETEDEATYERAFRRSIARHCDR
jgi:hypothetical protein